MLDYCGISSNKIYLKVQKILNEKNIKLFTSIHKSTKRKYLKRMNDNKIHYMNIAKKYDKNYWDEVESGYGGYKYIPNYWVSNSKKNNKTL